MDWLDISNKILNILGLLAIPSLFWNIFLYKESKKNKQFDLERELKKKEIEFNALIEKSNQEHKEAMENLEGEIGYRNPQLYVNFPTMNDKEKLSNLIKKSTQEMDILLADINYLKKMLGKKDFMLVQNSNLIQRISKLIRKKIKI